VHLGGRGSRWRCLLVWTSGTTSLAVVVALAVPGLERTWWARASFAETPLDVTVVEVATSVIVACCAWAWLALSAAVIEAWRGVGTGRAGPCHLPTGVRRVVLAACGVALASDRKSVV